MEFNNREIATFIIFIIFITFALYKSQDRQEIFSAFMQVIKMVFSKHIFTTIILFSIYMYYEISLLYKINVIESSMLKESIIWSFGAFVLIIKHSEITKEPNFVKQLIFDNLKFIVLFEFVCNMYTFRLPIEILLILFTTILIMMKTVMEYKELNEAEKLTMKLINFLLGLISFIIIIFTLNQLYSHYTEIEVIKNIKSFVLPLLLITLYIPFYYAVILFSTYEQLFASIDFFINDNKQLSNYLKRKVLFRCFINYSKLKVFHTNLNFQNTQTKQNIDNIFKNSCLQD